MPTINRFSEFHNEIAEWRRDIHAHPELMFDVHRTAGIVEARLAEFGVDEIVAGIGRTGVVGVIKGKDVSSGKVIALRADMDALPIQEARDIPHKSTIDGKMHGCGHDGHTAMLLGAAKYLSETRNFNGTAIVIFQPAEEDGGGADVMVKDGLMERFGIEEVYGMHNAPGLPIGEFKLCPGPLLAASDDIDITITARGGHAARPHQCIDPIVVASHLVQALQTVVSRNTDPTDAAVISIGTLHAGDARNVIAQTAHLSGTLRTLKSDVRDLVKERMITICANLGAVFGAEIDLDFGTYYPATINHPEQTAFSAGIARQISGHDKVDDNMTPVMGGEDFAYMLQARPGAFIFIGQGDTAGLHHPDYDFNDEIIPIGCSYWVKLVETAMPTS